MITACTGGQCFKRRREINAKEIRIIYLFFQNYSVVSKVHLRVHIYHYSSAQSEWMPLKNIARNQIETLQGPQRKMQFTIPRRFQPLWNNFQQQWLRYCWVLD